MGGDLVVGQPSGDQRHDLPFPVGEHLEPSGWDSLGWAGDVLADQPAGDGGGQECVASGRYPDRSQQVIGFDVLDQEPAGTGA
jgi:hypothetical protein